MEKANTDDWVIQDNDFKFIALIEILGTFDLGDEIGRQNLKTFISFVLSTKVLEENIVKKLVQLVESLITDSNARLQFFVDIVRGYTDPNNAVDFCDQNVTTLIESIKDPSLKVTVSALKLKILDLKEQETVAGQEKDYERLEKVAEELAANNEEMIRLLSDLEVANTSQAITTFISAFAAKKPTNECLEQCLQICFYAIASKQTKTLTPSVCQLYTDFIRRQMESKHMSLRDWALKCSIACSMLYEQLVTDTYSELTAQFYKHHVTRIWITAINGTFELIDCYGFEHFDKVFKSDECDNKAKKTRQLYNTMGYLNEENEEEEDSTFKAAVDLMYLFSHFLDTCEEASIIRALITGFCRLVLSDHFTSKELVSKLLVKFFSPATEHEVNQVLGIFFETLIKRRKQECLAEALLLAVNVILDAPNDSPLQEIKPDSVIKFVVNSTQPIYCAPGLNIHNDIAVSFFSLMNDNPSNKELLKLLSKEILTLEVSADPSLRSNLENVSDNLLNRSIDSKTESYIRSFKEILAGTYKGRKEPDNEEEEAFDEETELTETGRSSANESAKDETVFSDNAGVVEKSPARNTSTALETSDIENAEPYSSMPLTPPEEFGDHVQNDSAASFDGGHRVTSTQKSTQEEAKGKKAIGKAKAKATAKNKASKPAEDDEDNDNNENDAIPNTPTEELVSGHFLPTFLSALDLSSAASARILFSKNIY